MGDIRDSIRNSMLCIVNVASTICVEPVRFPTCDNPTEMCPHQRFLVSEIWDNDENRRKYNNLNHRTPNQIRAF